MITPAWVRLMSAYNAEMNRRLYAAAARLAPAQREEDRGAFFGSIRATLSHLAWADGMWMHRFAAWPKPEAGIRGSTALAWEELQAQRPPLDAGIEAWAAAVDPAWLGTSITWVSSVAGKEFTRPAWMLVTHMFNHQTHHRGQVHALLTAFGERTGDTDLPFILNEAQLAAG